MKENRSHIWRRQIISLVERIDNEHWLKVILDITAVIYSAIQDGYPLIKEFKGLNDGTP